MHDSSSTVMCVCVCVCVRTCVHMCDKMSMAFVCALGSYKMGCHK